MPEEFPAVRPARLWVFLVLLAMLGMLGPFSIDTPLPAFTEMGADLAVGTARMQLVVSSYLVAFALMSPFHGPLSDALGRRPVILAGISVYALASVGCALAPSLEVLLAFRVLQGLSAGGGVIVSRTVIRDAFDGAEAQRLMSTVMMIFGLAPALAPIIGGWLLQVGTWRVIFWFLTGVGLLLVALVSVALPETHPPSRRTPLRVGALVRSFAEPFRSLVFHRVAWSAALSFGGQFIYIGAASIFVVDLLGMGELDFWKLFVPMIGGVMLGAWVSGRTAGVVSARGIVTAGLVIAATGAVINVGLGLSPLGDHLPWAVVGPTVIAIGTATAYPAQQLTLLDLFPHSRGSAVSVFTFFTLMLNGVVASAVVPHVGVSVLGLALTAAVLVLTGLASWLWHLAATAQPAEARR